MPKLSAADHESRLRTRFRVALDFAQGNLGTREYGEAARALGISLKTLQRDIQRASSPTTFDEWRPKKRGPPEGKRRVAPGVFAIVETRVYANAATGGYGQGRS